MTAHAQTPPLGIVAGSGMDLRELFDVITSETPFTQYPQLPATTIAGHRGAYTTGLVDNRPVIVQQGRFHVYEGLSLEAVVAPLRHLHDWGCQEVIFCNAAGGLDAALQPGDLVAITHAAPWFCMRLPIREEVYSDFLVTGCRHSGSYQWVSGPSYETRAEIRAMQQSSHRVVGMSTLPEMVASKHLGMRCAAISCVTNVCGGATPLSHTHVLEVAQAGSAALCRLLRAHAASFSE